MKCKHGTNLLSAKCLNCEADANRYPATLDRITEVAVRRAEIMIATYKRIDEYQARPMKFYNDWGIAVLKDNPMFMDTTA